jgi:hypothetical protein
MPDHTPQHRAPRSARLRGPRLVVGLAVAAVLAGSGAVYADRAGLIRGGAPAGALNAPIGPFESPPGSARPSSTPTARPPAEITLSGVGDIIMGSAPDKMPPHDGAGYFDDVRESLKSDLVMGNLEEALSADTGHVKCGAGSTGCFAFHQPTRYAQVLHDGGFDLVNLANNHTMDLGGAGLTSTHHALDGAGISYTGAPGQITVATVNGVRVAVIGVAPYAWCQSLTDISSSAALVRTAAKQADLVVVQMQAGAEGPKKNHVQPGTEMFLGENRGDVLKFSHAMIDAGADLIIGHGPHVMRGMKFYRGRLIAFSLGNFTGYKSLSAGGWSGVGGILRVTLTTSGDYVRGTLIPTAMVSGGLPTVDPDRRAIGFVRDLSTQDFGDSAAEIAGTGAITPPRA